MPSAPIKSALTEPIPATPNEFAFALLAELRKPGRCVAPRLTLGLPNVVTVANLSPDADVDFGDSPSFTGGSSAADVTDDPLESPDDSTSYLSFVTGTTQKKHGVSFPDMPTGSDAITELRLYARGKRNATNSALYRFALRVNGTEYYGDTVDAGDRWANTAWRTTVLVFPLNPDTGAAWQEAEVNAVQAIFDYNPDAGVVSDSTQCTQFVLQVRYTTTVVGRYSSVALNSRTEGLWEGRVLDWGNFGYSVDGPSNSLQDVSFRVRLADHDFQFAELLEGENANQARRASAVVELVSPDVDPADWKTMFVGIFQKPKEVDPNVWEIELRPDDQAVDGVVTAGKITEPDFGAADPKSYDLNVPLLYGRHSALDLTNEGQIQLPLVDTARFWYLVCLGKIKAVDRVYTKDGDAVAVEQTSGFTVITPIINGRQFTIVEFTSSQGTKTVRADVQGYEELGDGTGILITNPADMLKHLLVNFVFNRYTSGLWLADSAAPVDVASFLETRDFFNDLGQGASRYLGGGTATASSTGTNKGDTTARNEINDWARQFEAKVFWTKAGTIGVGIMDFRTDDIYEDDNWIRENLHDLSVPTYEEDDKTVISGIEVSYLFSQADNAFLANITVQDFESDAERIDPIKAEWFVSAKPEAT